MQWHMPIFPGFWEAEKEFKVSLGNSISKQTNKPLKSFGYSEEIWICIAYQMTFLSQ
jgi:hypothetical protein